MDYLNTNLISLKAVDPILAARVEERARMKGVVWPVKDPAGYWNLQASHGESKAWLYRDVPQTIASAGKLYQDSRAQTVVILGAGLGYHLEGVLKKIHPFTMFLVLVEPSLDIFCSFLSMADRRSVLDNQDIIWFVEASAQEMEVKLLELRQKEHFAPCSFNTLILEWEYGLDGGLLFKNQWKRFQESLSSQLNVSFIDSYYGFMNFLGNWDRIGHTPLIQEFEGIFAGKPGIVVGSGPSLNRSIDSLRKLQDKAVIFAAGSALPVLLKHGIKAHLSSCLERNPGMKRVYQGLDARETYLVTTPVVDPEVFDHYNGPLIHMGRGQHFLPAVLPNVKTDSIRISSVSHVALYALWVMGCHPIYLVGQDLALDPYTKSTHTADYYNEISFDQLLDGMKGTRKVRSNYRDGRLVETWSNWYLYANHITEFIRSHRIDCFNIIPEDYGMWIEGTVRLEPEDAFQQGFQETINLKGTLDQVHSNFLKTKQLIYKESAAHSVEEAIPALRELINTARDLGHDIYNFKRLYLFPENPVNVTAYKDLESKINSLALKLKTEPSYRALIKPLTKARNQKNAFMMYSLLPYDEGDRHIIEEKICLFLVWTSEILIRTQMALRRLEKLQPRKQSSPAQ